MKVHIVREHFAHEGYSIVEVYLDEEKAKVKAKEIQDAIDNDPVYQTEEAIRNNWKEGYGSSILSLEVIE